MTLSEFKAWFEGFTECMDGAPDEKQWERIKARVNEIDGVAITKTVFIDRYVPMYQRYWSSYDVYGGALTAIGSAMPDVYNATAALKAVNAEFDSYNAMLDLGKAEYSAAMAS